MEFKKVNLDTINEEELLKVLDHNVRCASFTKAEIEKLRKATTSSDSKINIVVKKESVSVKERPRINHEFEEEVDYYLSDFRDLTLEELDEGISHILPSRKNDHYKDIVMRMIAEFVRDNKDIDEIIVSEKDTLSDTDKNLYEYEKLINNRKIEALREKMKAENKEDEEELDEDIENDLVFVTTAAGNVRVLDDLKSIPNDYYDGFLELFKSIKDGSFKNVKRFLDIESLKGASEVKDFKIRVVFFRIARDKYAVLTAFMKKSDNDMGYRKPLELKVKDFKNNGLKKMKEMVKKPEYLETQKEIEKELFRILGEEEKVVQKVKKGDEV